MISSEEDDEFLLKNPNRRSLRTHRYRQEMQKVRGVPSGAVATLGIICSRSQYGNLRLAGRRGTVRRIPDNSQTDANHKFLRLLDATLRSLCPQILSIVGQTTR